MTAPIHRHRGGAERSVDTDTAQSQCHHRSDRDVSMLLSYGLFEHDYNERDTVG